MLGIDEKRENSDNNIKNKEGKLYKVVPYLYSEELYEHILKKAFWVIEENNSPNVELDGKEPVKIGEGFRIKNVSNGLYLNLKQKTVFKISDSTFYNDYDKIEYEFNLVDYNTLNDNIFFENNFKFFHYFINDESKYIVDDGKYILKSVCKNMNKCLKNKFKQEEFMFSKIDSYYLPISISSNLSNVAINISNNSQKIISILNELIPNSDYIIRNEDDFIFNIKKVDILKGNEVIFILKIILKLENDLKSQQLNINILNDWLSFLIDYLINTEYSYKDNNHEANVPIEERQILLWKFNVINIIYKIINYFINNIDEFENNNQMNSKMLKLLFNILRFLLYLSKEQEKIKISIYILVLNKIVEFTEILVDDDFSKILYFIFDLVNDSEILQTYLLGDNTFLNKYVAHDPDLFKMDINIKNLININKILDFIEKSQNFLVWYQKLINLNKIQYKREEIIKKISLHIEKVKFKEKKETDTSNDNYIKMMKDSINEAKYIIKNNALLLNKLINAQMQGIRARKTKFRNSLIIRKSNFLDKKINSLKREVSGNFASDKKINYIESQKAENEENESKNPTIKSTQPLINIEDDYIKKSLLNNLVSKDSERQGLLESKNTKIISDKNIVRKSLRNNKNLPISPFTNLSSYKYLSKQIKNENDKNEEEKEEEEKKNKQDYQIILNKLGKIWYFIKWYEVFDFNYSLFIYSNYFKQIFNNKVKSEFIENQLLYFVNGNVKTATFIKDLKINTDSKTGILYLLSLYNTLFPKIFCKYENKINNNENITSQEILEDMKENNEIDPDYEYISNEDEYDTKFSEDSKKLDECLYSFYSSYQFYINQYVKIVHKLFYILSNYFLNSDKFGNLKLIRECYMKTLKILLSKVVFVEDNILDYLYSKIKLNPSLLSCSIDLDQIKEKWIQILTNLRKNNRNYEANNISLQEKKLIDYLILMCKQCDEIKYLYEKITVFKFIRNLIFSNRCQEEIKKQIESILELIKSKKRLPILLLYEKYNNRNKYELTLEERKKIGAYNNNYNLKDKNDSLSSYFYEVFKVGEITDFVTESLKLYETKEFFNNIIFVENQGNLISYDDKIIKKINKIIDQFLDIKNDILSMKINAVSKEAKIIEIRKSTKSTHIFNDEGGCNKELFEKLYRRIAQIRNDSLECFNDQDYHSYSQNFLIFRILTRENKTFFEKINFIGTLTFMTEALNYYKNKRDCNLLGYISNLLRILSKIRAIHPNFNKTIHQYFELYSSLILNSFQKIYQYNNLIDLNIEINFLNIFYYGSELFLYIIRNCKKSFIDTKEFMNNVFESILSIMKQFKTKKNRLISQILYLYTVCKLLLYLNSDKTYDFVSYKNFFKKIFPEEEIHKYFFNNLAREEIKVNALVKSKDIIEEKDEILMEDSDENSIEKSLDVSLTNLNVFPDEMHTYKLDSPYNNKINKINKNNIFNGVKKSENILNSRFKSQNMNIRNFLNDSLEWQDKEEIERLSFYVSFLFVYSLYLNEKNSMQKDNDEAINKKNNSKELSLNGLYKKYQSFLNYKNKEKYNNNTEDSPEGMSSLIDSIITEKTIDLNENSEIQNENYINEESNTDPGYIFIFALFQSIVNFQYSSRNKNIEIPIKQIEKEEEEEQSEIEDLPHTESQILLTNKKRNSINFFYYESKYIDIILIEKIINEISLRLNLKNYCLELAEYDNCKIPNLLKQFLKNQNYYKLIANYHQNEFKLINNLFVKNDLAVLIKKILNTFNQDDFSEIETMKYFLYKKMGEIYNQEDIKEEDELEQKNFNLIDYLELCEEKNAKQRNYLHFDKINLLNFLQSLICIYPKYEKKLCLLYYKIGFEILYSKSLIINNQKQKNKEDNFQEQINLELLIRDIILLFKKKSNWILIEDKYVFNTMLLSMIELYKSINNNSAFFFKHFKLIKEFLNSLEFILEHLSRDFDKIVNFMKRPENLVNSSKFRKKKCKLKTTLQFFIALLDFKKNSEEKILTDEIMNFTKKIIKKAIKLIFLLIEINKKKSIEIMNLLLDYLCKFIKGPDIENINMLFSLGYLDLVSYVIINIDYYKLFLNYLKKKNKREIIDNIAILECKIIKIFIAYNNISFSSYSNMDEFEKLQNWYEDNFKYIRKKLKKLFYISEKENEKRQRYDINKMLLFMKKDDQYSPKELYKRAGELISDDEEDDNDDNDNDNDNDNNTNTENYYNNVNKDTYNTYNNDDDNNEDNNDNDDDNNDNNNENNENNENNDNAICIDNKNKKKINEQKDEFKKEDYYCIVKFDLLLYYYTLFNYHKDLSDIEEKNALTQIKKRKDNMFYFVLNFFIDLGLFLINLIIVVVCFLYLYFKRFSVKIKEDDELLQDLSEIDIKCESYSDQKIINFLRNYIKEVEVSIKNVIYKVYFPMIDKANTLVKYKKEYLKVDEIDSSDFTNYLLSNYDYINIRAKQNALINKWIDEFPIFNYIFKNMYIYAVLLIIFGVISNLLIITSFSTFFDNGQKEKYKCEKNFIYAKSYKRVQCPHFLYKEDSDSKAISLTLKALSIVELILQSLTFLDYFIRKLAVESEIVKLNYKICNLKNLFKKKQNKHKETKSILKFNKCTYILFIAFPTIYRCLLNFQTIYYIMSLLFLSLGIALHPFFNCIVLLEFVNRIQLLQTILKAMYKPAKNIVINLLMFIILEYFFSFFAVSWYTYHFPNETDTSTFLKTFMRMIDQTFKQDGGIGTYLDKSLDDDFVRYSVSSYINGRFFFDLLFFLIILLLIFQMFLSIIIDYFNETREKSEDFEDNLETQCIVCGIEREKIEKINTNDKNAFDKHIQYYHNVFNYIYYLMYLQSSSMKDVIIDSSVWDLHLEKNLSYLPKNICFKQLEKRCWKKFNQRKNKEEEE